MGTEENKAIVRRWYEEVNKGNLDVIDELLSPNFVRHTTGAGQVEMTGHPDVIALMKRVGAASRATVPDGQWTIEHIVAEGEWVATYHTSTGTWQGNIEVPGLGTVALPPGGKRVTSKGMWLRRVVDGKIVEFWGPFVDMLSIYQQLGFTLTPAAVKV